jgi:hypothetical protein
MQLADYVRDFNRCVHDGDWSRLADWFTVDAVLEFVGPSIGPFVGRSAIAAAYATNPPDDEIELVGQPTVAGEVTTAVYRWATSGARGSMRLVQRGQLIGHVTVTVDLV